MVQPVAWCDDCATGHIGPACPRADERIYDNARAQHTVGAVRNDLARLGLATPDVPIQLVDSLGGYHGVAQLEIEGATRSVPRIEVLRGLGPVLFSRVVAHELAHAVLHLTATAPIDPGIEEGVCEMVAVVWLCGCDRPEVDAHLKVLWHEPDPVYGEQMRAAVRAGRRHGVPAVLDAVRHTGRLP